MARQRGWSHAVLPVANPPPGAEGRRKKEGGRYEARRHTASPALTPLLAPATRYGVRNLSNIPKQLGVMCGDDRLPSPVSRIPDSMMRVGL